MDQDNTVPSVLMQEKTCSMCHQLLKAEEFYVLKGKLSSRCRPCTRMQVRSWAKENKERADENRRQKDRRRYHTNPAVKAKSAYKSKSRYYRLKTEVMNAYGAICACCGETTSDFLTIDHINNDGAKFRTRTGGGKHGATGRLYGWIINNNFPSDFQVLCYNCNCGKARNGGVCPHKNEGVEAIPSGSTLKRVEVRTTLPITYGC